MRSIVYLVRETIDLTIKIDLEAYGQVNYQETACANIHEMSKKSDFSAKMLIGKSLSTIYPLKVFSHVSRH